MEVNIVEQMGFKPEGVMNIQSDTCKMRLQSEAFSVIAYCYNSTIKSSFKFQFHESIGKP